MATIEDCRNLALDLSVLSRRTYAVRGSGDDPGLDLVEVLGEHGAWQCLTQARRDSPREMRTHLRDQAKAALTAVAERRPAFAMILAAGIMDAEQERRFAEVRARRLGGWVVVLGDDDDDQAPCRMYTVAMPIDGRVAYVWITTESAPASAPTVGELERVAHAVLLRG